MPHRSTRFQRGGGKVLVETRARQRGSDAMLTDSGLGMTTQREQLRVLVAEDRHVVREAAAALLAKSGMVVRTVDGAESIGFVMKHFRPHVVVLDDHFERSGIAFKSVLPDLLGLYPSVGIVVTTNAASQDGRSGSDPLMWGATEVIDKHTMLQGSKLENAVKHAAGL